MEREIMEDLREPAPEVKEDHLPTLLRGKPSSLLDGDVHALPLHMATLYGQPHLVRKYLALNPKLAGASDSRGWTALHLAAGIGIVEIARVLVGARPQVCEAVDRDGRNPLHVAAINGNDEVLRLLVLAWPQATLARVGHGETILHLCVKYIQMKALDILLVEADDDRIRALANAKDDYGYTVLHEAVDKRQTQMVKYLLESGNINDVNAKNASGYTAVDILAHGRGNIEDWEIGNYLRESGASGATDVPTTSNSNASTSTNGIPKGRNPKSDAQGEWLAKKSVTLMSKGNASTRPNGMPKGRNPKRNPQGEWLAKKSDTLIWMATLLAAMAFQVVISPPGGLRQNNSPEHRVGEAVIAHSCPDLFEFFIYGNTMGFVACLSTILLLMSGLPFKHNSFLWILMVNVWLSIVSIAYTYLYTIVTITPEEHRGRLRRIMFIVVPLWCGLMFLIVHWQIIRSMGRWLLKKYKNVRPPTNYSAEANHVPDNQDVQIQMTDR